MVFPRNCYLLLLVFLLILADRAVNQIQICQRSNPTDLCSFLYPFCIMWHWITTSILFLHIGKHLYGTVTWRTLPMLVQASTSLRFKQNGGWFFFLKAAFFQKIKTIFISFFHCRVQKDYLGCVGSLPSGGWSSGVSGCKRRALVSTGRGTGGQGGTAGRVPVLGPEKRLLVGLRPDELVSPACGRDRAHTPSDSAHRRVLPLPTTAGRGLEQTRCQRDLNQEWRRRGC